MTDKENLERAYYKLNQEYLDIATDLTSVTLYPEASEKETLEEATKRFENTIKVLKREAKKFGVSVDAYVNGLLRIQFPSIPKKKSRKMKSLKK